MSGPLAVILEGTVEAGTPEVEAAEIRTNSDEIGRALKALGFRTAIVTLTLDVAAARRKLEKLKPDVCFNLVDSIEGMGDLVSMAPMLLTHLKIPYTGTDAGVTTVTCDKLLSKQILKANGIRTAPWLTQAEIEAGGRELTRPYILKSITEHASFGLGANSVVKNRATLKKRLAEKRSEFWGDWFAEAYIEGREFNLGLLASTGKDRVTLLPPAEIVFTKDFPKNKPKIIDYAAKWHTQSKEYIGTVRNFEGIETETKLRNALRQMARQCWDAFNLTGYARVDFRVDTKGVPYVLEVNSNPFLTPNEGFGVAAKRAGLSFEETVGAIVADAYRRAARPIPKAIAA
jgi:D-alanine-D-alanine ligase